MKVKDVDALREQISKDPREAFTKHQVWLFASVHNKTVPTIEAIPKADVVAMLEELYMEIEELDTPSDDDSYDAGIVDCEKLIQQKINALAESEADNGNDD